MIERVRLCWVKPVATAHWKKARRAASRRLTVAGESPCTYWRWARLAADVGGRDLVDAEVLLDLIDGQASKE